MQDWWNNVLTIPGAKWIVYPSLLLVLVLVAYYVLQLFRNMAIGGTPASDDYLGSFRKMRDQGMIGADEYKKLAGLVPLPETEAKAEPEETGAEALTEAAKAVIKKTAMKNSPDPVADREDSEDAESEQSAES